MCALQGGQQTCPCLNPREVWHLGADVWLCHPRAKHCGEKKNTMADKRRCGQDRCPCSDRKQANKRQTSVTGSSSVSRRPATVSSSNGLGVVSGWIDPPDGSEATGGMCNRTAEPHTPSDCITHRSIQCLRNTGAVPVTLPMNRASPISLAVVIPSSSDLEGTSFRTVVNGKAWCQRRIPCHPKDKKHDAIPH